MGLAPTLVVEIDYFSNHFSTSNAIDLKGYFLLDVTTTIKEISNDCEMFAEIRGHSITTWTRRGR